MEVKERGATDNDDAKIMQDQEAYFDEVASKVYAVLTMAECYEKSYAAYVKKHMLDETLRSQEKTKGQRQAKSHRRNIYSPKNLLPI